MKDTRLSEFDIFRAFLALSVIAIHVTAGYMTNSSVAYILNQVVRYAVPLFVVLSGFILYYNDNKSNREVTYILFLKKRLRKVLVPYLIWTGVYFLFSARREILDLIDESIFHTLLLYMRHIVYGTGYIHLYFILIVIQLYFLYPGLKKWFDLKPKIVIMLSLLVTLLAQTLIYMHQLKFIKLPSIGIPYVSIFPIWLLYFVFGMAAAKYKAQWDKFIKGKRIFLGFIWLFSLGILVIDGKYTATFSSSIKPTIIFYSIFSYFFIYSLLTGLSSNYRKTKAFISWIGTHSFFIYLVHPIILSGLVIMSKRANVESLWNDDRGLFLLFILTTILSLLITYITSHFPRIDLLGGIYKKRL